MSHSSSPPMASGEHPSDVSNTPIANDLTPSTTCKRLGQLIMDTVTGTVKNKTAEPAKESGGVRTPLYPSSQLRSAPGGVSHELIKS